MTSSRATANGPAAELTRASISTVLSRAPFSLRPAEMSPGVPSGSAHWSRKYGSLVGA